MKLSRISFLCLLLVLFVPTVSFAQSAAEKSWKPFWSQFTAAVKSKSKPDVKRLMSSEDDFFSGGGGETRNEWLTMLDEDKLWDEVQRSMAKGVVAYNEDKKTGRITKDRNLIFQYLGGKWRFVGIMGD